MCLVCGYTCRNPICTMASGGAGEWVALHKRMYGRPAMPLRWEGDDS